MFRALTSLDWLKARGTALVGGGELKLANEINEGVYASAPLDSGIPDCTWHRIVIDAQIPENSFITISARASDDMDDLEAEPEDVVPKDAEAVTFKQVNDSFLAGQLGAKQSNDLRPREQQAIKQFNDSLLREQRGRFIRLWIRIRRAGKETPELKQVKIFYPRLSYLRYLPAVYQEESESRDFLEKFLSVFESKLQDSDEIISRLPAYFDPLATPNEPEKDFVKWLASWLSLDLYELLGEKNRDFILNAINLYKMKGTAQGLSGLACTITGKRRCCVKEYKNNVFRTFGLESKEEEKPRTSKRCAKFYRNMSKTIDPGKMDLKKAGNYEDELHYVFGTNLEQGRIYSPNVVGLFIFSPPGEPVEYEKEKLLKILRSFLPAFVEVKPYLLDDSPDEETYLKPEIMECMYRVTGSYTENPKAVEGVYKDAVNWEWIYTYQQGTHESKEVTAKSSEIPKFRTIHDGIGIGITI